MAEEVNRTFKFTFYTGGGGCIINNVELPLTAHYIYVKAKVTKRKKSAKKLL